MLDQSTGTEIKGHQLEKLDANKQEINELDNNAELEAVVGGGFIQKHPLLTVGGALGIGGVVGFGGGLGTGFSAGTALSASQIPGQLSGKGQ